MTPPSRKIVTIGSDPEFGFRDRVKNTQVGAASLPFSFRVSEGNVGRDGHNHIAELRPKHSQYVQEHVENIRALIANLADKMEAYPALAALAGSFIFEGSQETIGDAIGGHIHFGIRRHNITGGLRKSIAEALDYWVAPVAMLIEVPKTAKLRRTCSTPYGFLGTEREQDWGMEWRPCSSWLVSPATAYAVLSYAYCVVDAVVNGELPSLPKVYKLQHGCRSSRLHYMYKRVDKPALLAHYHIIKPHWKKFPMLSRDRYIAGGIGYLSHLISRGRTWRENTDLRTLWKVTPPPIPEEDISAALTEQRASLPSAAYRTAPRLTMVRWPGPGMDGHSTFKQVFQNGHRFLCFRTSYPIFIIVVEGLSSVVDAHIAASYSTGILRQAFRDRVSTRALGLNVSCRSAIRAHSPLLELQDERDYLIFDQAWLESYIQQLVHDEGSSWHDHFYQTLHRIFRDTFRCALGDWGLDHGQASPMEVDPECLVESHLCEGEATEPSYELQHFIWHHSQLPSQADEPACDVPYEDLPITRHYTGVGHVREVRETTPPSPLPPVDAHDVVDAVCDIPNLHTGTITISSEGTYTWNAENAPY